MKKLIVSVLAIALLAGCGTAKDKETGSSANDKVIKIGASVTPHAEILEQVKPVLEKQGYTLDIVQFTDYNKPNQGLLEGSLDANFFQHMPYLEKWAANAGASDKLSGVFFVHFEPLGIYSSKYKNLDIINEGAKIAIPNDETNGGRALKLLEAKGIIKLKDGVGFDAKKNDITENKQNVEIIEMQAETCATSLQDVDFAVVNGNNALNAKILENVITKEDKNSEAAQLYANVIAVQTAHAQDEKIQALLQALNTEEVKNFIDEKYDGIVVPLVPSVG